VDELIGRLRPLHQDDIVEFATVKLVLALWRPGETKTLRAKFLKVGDDKLHIMHGLRNQRRQMLVELCVLLINVTRTEQLGPEEVIYDDCWV
jgi:hypothetical protein